jgi:hypothetical protein
MRYRDLLVIWSMLLATATGPVGAAETRAGPAEKVRLSDTPMAVQERIRRESPTRDSRVTIERQRLGQETVYDVEIKDGYREIEFLVDEKGRLLPQTEKPD